MKHKEIRIISRFNNHIKSDLAILELFISYYNGFFTNNFKLLYALFLVDPTLSTNLLSLF